MPLMHKSADAKFSPWMDLHQTAFAQIKGLVLGADCLTTINHDDMGDNKVFVTCNASDWRTGTVLSYGPTWETPHPVTFDSVALKSAQLHYPTHEKELLAIIRALQKWRSELLSVSFTIITDHQTLENFNHQKDLSHQQARWQESLSQYHHHIHYIPGEDNCVADALSHLPNSINDIHVPPLTAMLTGQTDNTLLQSIKDGYVCVRPLLCQDHTC